MQSFSSRSHDAVIRVYDEAGRCDIDSRQSGGRGSLNKIYTRVGGRYNLNKAFYLTGKVDVGGFDVGSKVTVQAYGGLGCELTRSIYAELGCRYLYYDYDSGGYLYKVSTYGPQITVGAQF